MQMSRLCTTSSSSSLVRLADDDQDATVKVMTLDQPDNLNAMTAAMGDAVETAVAALRALPPTELRALVLTGSGRAFSAGGDLDFLDARRADSPTNNSEVMRRFYARFLSIRQVPVPVVACINGPAIGVRAPELTMRAPAAYALSLSRFLHTGWPLLCHGR